MMDVLRRAVMATNRFGAGELDELRIRMGLISSVPTLVAHSAVRYAEWCDVVAGFVAGRMGVDAGRPRSPDRGPGRAGGGHGRVHLLGPAGTATTCRPRWTGPSGCWPPGSTRAGWPDGDRPPAGRTGSTGARRRRDAGGLMPDAGWRRAQGEAIRMKIRAAVCSGLNEPWKVEEVDVDPPGPHEVVVQMAYAGMCHSDEHLRTGDMSADPEVLEVFGVESMFPMIGGHEGAGIVTEVGPGVESLAEGDHVAASFIPACGRCFWCAPGASTCATWG